MPLETPTLDAAKVAAIRDLLSTSLGSAELRDALAEDIRARSVFAARLGNLTVLSKLKEVVDTMANGKMDLATARVTLMELLHAVGYTPEGGFPEAASGEVPPAVRGSLQDLSSKHRLDFMLRTQLALVRGRGQQLRGLVPARLKQFPAYELVRVQAKVAPRRWGGQHDGTPPLRGGSIDPRPRWIIAGGRVTADGRLLALKGDPVFGELGSSGNFDDALDVDYAPFAFNSGMRLVERSRGECNALRITGPNGETIDEWQAMTHPLLVDTQSGIPVPQASIRNLDPELVKVFEKSAGIKIVETTATTAGNEAEIRRVLAVRKAARDARGAELLRKGIADRKAEYAGRSAP